MCAHVRGGARGKSTGTEALARRVCVLIIFFIVAMASVGFPRFAEVLGDFPEFLRRVWRFLPRRLECEWSLRSELLRRAADLADFVESIAERITEGTMQTES